MATGSVVDLRLSKDVREVIAELERLNPKSFSIIIFDNENKLHIISSHVDNIRNVLGDIELAKADLIDEYYRQSKVEY